jgi:hypothetical protein
MHPMKDMLRALALLALFAATPALAINKCMVNGKPVYQDAPCEDQGETVGQGRERQKRLEAYHRELDQLANQGYGMRRQEPSPPQAPKEEPETVQPKSRTQALYEQQAAAFRRREETERRNAESAAALTRLVDDMAEKCKGDPKQPPKVGMSDAEFRNCTIHARLGGVTQVVAVERDGVPLRLYIFPGEPRRVYSVDGVVTAIR